MSRGRRLLTDEQERSLVARACLRDTLTDKALAREFGITERGVRAILNRCRNRYGANRRSSTDSVDAN
jgi:hypothetical protein